MTVYRYRGFTLKQPNENTLQIERGRNEKAMMKVDHFYDMNELRELIDDYGDCIFVKEKRWEHKGYTLVQTEYNWHFMIYETETGRMVMHAQGTRPLTDEEAKRSIEEMLKFREEIGNDSNKG